MGRARRSRAWSNVRALTLEARQPAGPIFSEVSGAPPLAICLGQAGQAEVCRRAWLVAKVSRFLKSNAFCLQGLHRLPRFPEVKNHNGGSIENDKFLKLVPARVPDGTLGADQHKLTERSQPHGRPVESKIRTYHGRVKVGWRTAGRRSGAGWSRTGRRRVHPGDNRPSCPPGHRGQLS